MHDLLVYGRQIEKYDHHEFPGVVPRSFLGAIAVATMALPFHTVATLILDAGHFWSAFVSQYIVRCALGCISVSAVIFLRHTLRSCFGHSTSVAFALTTIAQFHLPYYWSRSLPNTIALVLSTVSLAFWIRGYEMGNSEEELDRSRGHLRTAIGFLTMAAVIFRCDVIILLACCCLQALCITPRLSVLELLATGLRWGLASLAVTVLVDSILWGRLLWPELEVFLFNTVENRSSEWGTSPWHWYLTNALPKALLPSAICMAVAGFYHDWRRVATIVAPSVGFVLLFSALPHKELRFIFHAIPPINVVASIGLANLHRRREKSWAAYMQFVVAILLFVGSTVIALSFCYVSSQNYPGGEAMETLHRIAKGNGGVHVHIGIRAAMTGVTRFTQADCAHTGDPWLYSKDETIQTEVAYVASGFTHIITDAPQNFTASYEQVAEIVSFDAVSSRPHFIAICFVL
jgi:alpha-1,6-mannosyltransferase